MFVCCVININSIPSWLSMHSCRIIILKDWNAMFACCVININKLTHWTIIRIQINFVQHTQCSNVTSMTQQETLNKAKPGHWIHLSLEKLKITFSSRSLHQRIVLKDWKNKCIVQRSKAEVSTRTCFINLKIPIIWETQEIIPHRWSSMVILLSNFMLWMFKLGLAQMETPEKTKSPWEGFTVLDLLTTKELISLGFIIMYQWLHHSWILAKSQLREAATAGLSAGNNC